MFITRIEARSVVAPYTIVCPELPPLTCIVYLEQEKRDRGLKWHLDVSSIQCDVQQAHAISDNKSGQ